jgi:hypothetical protein
MSANATKVFFSRATAEGKIASPIIGEAEEYVRSIRGKSGGGERTDQPHAGHQVNENPGEKLGHGD